MRIQNKEQVLGTGALMTPTKVHPEYGEPEQQALLRALEGEWGGIGSEEIAAQEREFRQLWLADCFASVSVTNGTHAIQLILEALNIGFGDRVIVPGMTFQATAAAVVDVNAIPIILDVDETGTLDPDLVEAWLAKTQGTPEMPVAVIAVYLYRFAPMMRRLFEICKRFGVWLIEDCAQGQGAVVDGRPAMSWGVASSTSRQVSKPRNSGEGGDMVTGVPVLEQRLRALQNCGRPAEATIPDDAYVDEVVAYWRARVTAAGLKAGRIQSGNYRVNSFTDAIARAQNERFWDQHNARAQRLDLLDEVMPTVPGITWIVQPDVASPVCYRIAFLYDPHEFAGMDNDTFREVLAFLLGGHRNQKVERWYQPLNNCDEYDPRSKKRHQISPDYVEAIDPHQWELARCEELYRRGITIEQSFAREPQAASALPRALGLMYELAPRIVRCAS